LPLKLSRSNSQITNYKPLISELEAAIAKEGESDTLSGDDGGGVFNPKFISKEQNKDGDHDSAGHTGRKCHTGFGAEDGLRKDPPPAAGQHAQSEQFAG
jgi:hypothetical protein